MPAPACSPGGVLVRSLYSLISTGTEMMKVDEAKLSLVGKARARPDQVRKVLDTRRAAGRGGHLQEGHEPARLLHPARLLALRRGRRGRRGAPRSSHVGQLVACAGNEYALHAEVNWVPTNLCVPVPPGVARELAAFATVGAIAMHGVRRAEAQLGETACVIGLGLVGQLVVQLLVAAGVRVVGLDVVEDRCRRAEKAGARPCAAPTATALAAVAAGAGRAHQRRGADHVFLAAGGSSNGPVEAAAQLARDRARVVDIGKCRLDLPWNDYYEKELDVRFSRSYGPGRYDDRYELDGIDYPAGYVRWTERRNLACFLDLLAREEIELETLVSGTFPVDGGERRLRATWRSGELPGVGFLFEYPRSGQPGRPAAHRRAAVVPAARQAAPRGTSAGQLAVGFIGAGNYASSMLLPHLAKTGHVRLAHVATNRSLSAVNAQRRFGFAATSRPARTPCSRDGSLDAVFIVTRHHSHADLVCRALETGKAVFVEKPLALTRDELDRVARRRGEDRQRPAHGRLQPTFRAAARRS